MTIQRMDNVAIVVKDLDAAYTAAPEEMPGRHAGRVGDVTVPRVVCDYIAGMTDSFILEQYAQIKRAVRR